MQIARVRGVIARATSSGSRRNPVLDEIGTATGTPPAASTAEGMWK